VEVGEELATARLRPPHPLLVRVVVPVDRVALQREVRFGFRKRRVQLDSAASRFGRRIGIAQVPENESQDVVRIRHPRAEPDRRAQRRLSLFTLPQVVEQLADRKVEHGAPRVHLQRSAEPAERRIEAAPRLLRLTQRDQRLQLVSRPPEDRPQLRDGFLRLAGIQVCLGEPAPRIGIARVLAQALPQSPDQAGVVARGDDVDLEVAAGELHPGVDRERALEGRDRLVVHPLVEVEHAEVVVRTCIPRVDPVGESPEYPEIALGTRGLGQAPRRCRQLCSHVRRGGSSAG
jgi:hypothetical protein